MIFLLWPRLSSVLCSFHAALTHARPFLPPLPASYSSSFGLLPTRSLFIFCFFHNSLKKINKWNKTSSGCAGSDCVHVSLHGGQNTTYRPAACNGCRIRGIMAVYDFHQRSVVYYLRGKRLSTSFLFVWITKNGEVNNMRWRETGRQIRLRGWSASRLIQEGFGSIRVRKKTNHKKKKQPHRLLEK